MKFFTIDPTDVFLTMLFPNCCHRAIQRVRNTLLRRKDLKLTTEARITGKIRIKREKILHIDFGTNTEMFFTQCFATVATKATGCFPKSAFTIQMKPIYEFLTQIAI